MRAFEGCSCVRSARMLLPVHAGVYSQIRNLWVGRRGDSANYRVVVVVVDVCRRESKSGQILSCDVCVRVGVHALIHFCCVCARVRRTSLICENFIGMCR